MGQEITRPDINTQVGFGAWLARARNTVYQAATDGLVLAFRGGGADGNVLIDADTDGANPPVTVRQRANGSIGAEWASLAMPVRAGDYWEVVCGGATTVVFWIPLA